ncbi:ankyrin repeat domain-containing protein [Halomonas cerina]|uniref:Ankyrin repeat protein n=1 Tax=Halomonas cerina TaxID=447424 RepID=A0A839V5D0_9GAMM|nr:ankyrin repeat domain-containing protein [Halomonas cerina]MBB3189198.1 ankyrin repeat protein [Halomonas cerina]
MFKSIFISSSGDLKSLREGLHDDLQRWLDHHGFGHLLKPFLWDKDKEDGRLLSDRLQIQSQLPDPAAQDVPLTICLFGERCGSPLEDNLAPHVVQRFDRWRAQGEDPGLLHPWPRDAEKQRRALACGQYPLTGTVFELLSAHAQPEEADNLIVACVVDRPIMPETSVKSVVLNGRNLHARLVAGKSESEANCIEAEIYNPQATALLNFLKDYSRKVRFVKTYPSEDDMRCEVFAVAQKKLRQKLGIASLRNPFKQTLDHWTVDDSKPLPGRSGAIEDIMKVMDNRDALILLKGRSGCGKSSLMQSGVMRSLREIDGSVPVPFRPTELMAGAGEGDALDRLARLIAETAAVPFPAGGPKAMRPDNYAKRLRTALDDNHINLVVGLDQFEEIIDELKLERERSTGMPQSGWWLVIRFLKALCGSPRVRLIATLESARETSFWDLRIGEEIGLLATTINVDATEDTVAEIARSGFARGGLPLAPPVIAAIKRQWTVFEQGTPNENASPLPLACLFFHRLYERFADRAGATADERLEDERLESAFQQADSRKDDRVLTLEEIGGEGSIAFADIIQKLADEAWRAGDGNPAFADPIETDADFNGLNNFLKPLVTVDHDTQIQLRAAVEIDADLNTRKQRRAFRESRLLVPVPGEGPRRLRPVHQALIDRWYPARRWLAYRKHQLRKVQSFRDHVAYYHRRGEPVPMEEDGSTLRDAAMTLSEHALDWRLCRGRTLGSEDAALLDQALAVFDTVEDPFTVLEGSPFGKTYGHLAAEYHRVDLLCRFIAVQPACLQIEDQRGFNLLHSAAFSNGPAVPFLIAHGVPLKTEKNQWNAISIPIFEKQNANFNVMIGHLGIDDLIEISTELRLIHLAATSGNMYVIEHLIEHGATLDVQNKYKRTALHHAAIADQVDAFRYLLPHIDIQKQDNWKGTAVSSAALFGGAKVLSAYLSEEGDADRLSSMLYHRNDTGYTPLMISVRHRQPEALLVLLQRDLGDLGDPAAAAHRGKNGDTLFHCLFRGLPNEKLTETDRFRARTVVEILLQDSRLHPNLQNDNGETPFDLGGAFPEARRVLRQDERVPRDYATMTPAMRIEDLSSRRPATVLRLLREAQQALTDVHEPAPGDRADVSAKSKRKPRAAAGVSRAETGLDILVRLKNHVVLATLADDPVHWPTLRAEFQKLLTVAAVPSAGPLREALLRRFAEGELEPNEAGQLLGASVDAADAQIARVLVDQDAPLTLRRDGQGYTVLHRAAITGDVELFRSVLAIGPFALPLDRWGRRPSDMAPETLAETVRALEADMGEPAHDKASSAVSSTITGKPPFLSLERDSEARWADDKEMTVLKRGWNEEWGDIGTLDIRVFDLPFHPDVPLIELRPHSNSAGTGRLCFLLQGDTLHRLNGTSPPIHEVNGKEKPFIHEATVLHYLTFFCFFVRGEDGPFLIVDRPENSFLADLGERSSVIGNIFRPPRVWGKDNRGNWRVSSLVYYADAVFLANFRVQPVGKVEMIDDTPILTDLPDGIDAPLEIRPLH